MATILGIMLLSSSPFSSIPALSRALEKCGPGLDPSAREQIAIAIDAEARRAGYDPMFVQAIVEVESHCSPRARSKYGAVGLIQVMPAVGQLIASSTGMVWEGHKTLLDPVLNLRIGLAYLAALHQRFGDMPLAMAAYNLGPGRAANISPSRARQQAYVRKVVLRYQRLLEEHAMDLA